MKLRLLTLLLFFASCLQLRAEIHSLTVISRRPFAEGKSFGDGGAYDIITAVARYAIDPKNPRNQAIVDLDLATPNAQGKVEFAADVCILAPKDPVKGNGAILYDVNNRGNKLALGMFNHAPSGNDLTKPNCEGDGYLMRRGYTVVWSGWIGELLAGNDRMLLQAALALENGKPIRGLVRFEMSTDKPAKSLPLSRREGHGNYTPTKEGIEKATVTVRSEAEGKREIVPREKWKLVTSPRTTVKAGINGTLDQTRLELEEGFQPGLLYELICECEGSLVMGTGFAAVRDLISFLRHDMSDKNPLRTHDGKPTCNRAHAFGVSQSGRFLRHLLWQGFNEDEEGRIVFDGLMPHVAGGGLGYFNHRFAQPTRHNGQHEDHTYLADFFPFTYGDEMDPFRRRVDSILKIYAKSKQQPKVMHTQSAAEYWHRAGSLVHTDPRGLKDSIVPDNVRIYAFGGTQHGPASDPPSKGIGQNLANPGDYRPFLRALLDSLDAWVKDGKEPPASMYPRFANKTLVDWRKAYGFPKIPGVRTPEVIHMPAYCDYKVEPPRIKVGYRVFVPKPHEEHGNDLGCLLPPEVAVPLATYTGWNLRAKEFGAENMLASLMGSYIPFARTKAEREKTGDSRLSLGERYGNFDRYEEAFKAACANLVKSRYLLTEDAERLVRNRTKVHKLFALNP